MVPSFKRQILEIPAGNETKQFNIIWPVNVQKERSIFEGSAISLVRLVVQTLPSHLHKPVCCSSSHFILLDFIIGSIISFCSKQESELLLQTSID